MTDAQAFSTEEPSSSRKEIHEALRALQSRLRRSTDDPLHLEFLEDDLLEGKSALSDVQAFFGEILHLLARRDATAAELIDLADDNTVVERLDDLDRMVASLRKRLLQLAVRGRH
jgi:hypothetical protein